MISRDEYAVIQHSLAQFRYTSLHYVEYGDVSEYEIVVQNPEVIVLYGYQLEADQYEYHWACNHLQSLTPWLSSRHEKEKITFIPKEWVTELIRHGFEWYAVWNDYVAVDIEKYAIDEEPHFVCLDECVKASAVTISCRGQSRGFTGQTAAWMRQWSNNEEPAAPDYAAECAVLAARVEETLAGVICIAIYGEETSRTLWIREVAVTPAYQGKGYARKLIGQAYTYGLRHGAKKAFLMADECNKAAIRLYESMGFKATSEDGQIDMIR